MTLSANDFASGSGHRVDRVPARRRRLDDVLRHRWSVSGEGSHTIQFHATDNAGNVEGVKSKSFTIDTTGPVISITTPSQGEQHRR